MEKYTVESLFDGRLRLRQPQNGYRYTLDPILLCSHVRPGKTEKILDAGCGCGIIPLVIGTRHPNTTITGVEIQRELAELAHVNITQNHMTDRIRIINKDILELTKSDAGAPFDMVISNPPYKKVNTGRINPNHQKAIARHEITLTISALFNAADNLLRPGGQIMIILPAERLFDLHQAMAGTSIRPVWIKSIHPSAKKNAIRIIACGAKNFKSSCRVLPPFILYDKDNNPTKEHRSIFNA
ncbi:MAG: methyltransferase [Desulfobacter sp.]|nr:MAG: methyltransferase [Desulfobacter sp.]